MYVLRPFFEQKSCKNNSKFRKKGEMLRRKVKGWGKNIDKNKINFEEKNVIPANRNSLVIFSFFCGGGHFE